MLQTIEYNAELHIVETVVQGPFTLDDIRKVFEETARVLVANDCYKVLGDYRKAIPKVSTLEIYDLPQIVVNIYAKAGGNARATKRALVVSADAKEYVFYETVTVNSGQNARLFHDPDEARTWLLGK
jgi:hypothetical protein